MSSIRELGTDPVYLGLNTGHLGFLLNDVDDLDTVAQALATGSWKVHAFPRLSMEATAPDGSVHRATAVNDLYMERSSGQTAHLRLQIDGVTVVERLVCDGLLASTALGSTAYSFSAGGVPCHPLLRATHITPVCPHSPRLSPFLLPPDKVIEVEALTTDRRPVRAVADGVSYGAVTRLRIGSDHDMARLAFLEGHHFTRALIRKVLMS